MSHPVLQWQDEILQVLYWMRGERLGEEVPTEQLDRFLKLSPEALGEALRRLQARGLVACTGPAAEPRFRLTPEGVAEGRRRFLEEFSPMLGKESHLECSDPGCDCHSEGWSGACPSADPGAPPA